MNNDARSKLRSMGGIMASSPELMQVVRKFQVGGNVSAGPSPLRTIPDVRQPKAPSLGPRNPGYDPGLLPSGTIDPVLPGTRRVAPISPDRARRNAILERAAAGSPTYGSGAQPYPSAPDMPFEPRVPAGPEAGSPQLGRDRIIRNLTVGDSYWRLPEGTTIDDLLDTSDSKGLTGEFRRADLAGVIPPPVETEDTRAGRGFGRIGDVVARATPDPEKTEELLPRVEAILNNEPVPGSGGAGDVPRPQARRDLRSRYKEKLELFKEIYGTDDKDEAQDRAMSLAMIGLAIAAGQSPDALTNIAQGALAGLQGVGAQREADRERERGMKTLALQSAIDQMGAEAEADADAARMDQEQRNRLELEREKARLAGPSGGGAEALKRSPASRIYGDALTSVLSQIDKEEIYPPEGVDPTEFAKARAVSVALDTLELNVAEGLIDPEIAAKVRSELRSIGGAQTTADPKIQARVDEALKNYTPDQVRKGLTDSGIDPTLYGL